MPPRDPTALPTEPFRRQGRQEPGTEDARSRRRTAPIQAASGFCTPIRSLVPRSDVGRLAAGIHELAHALVGEDAAAARLTYAQEELVVESIAWSCCQTVGLDTTANSIPYLTSWAQSASLEILEQTAALTGRLADRIDAALGERPTDTVLEPATAATRRRE